MTRAGDGDMQLRHLETFISIIDAGTLTAAAELLYKSQGAVSQDLKSLESSLGVPLIDRSGQRVRLTPAGKALLPMARRLLAEVADVRAEMGRVRAGERPVLRLASLPSIAPAVARLLADFRDDHPETRWSLVTSLRGSMIEGLRDGRLDLAICEAQADDGMTNAPLGREPLHIVLPHGHPLAAADRLRPADLTEIPYVGLARGMGATAEAQRFFAAGDVYPTPDVEVSDTRLVLELVPRIGGFGILPDSVLGDGRVVAVEADPPLTRQISLVHFTGRHLSPTAKAFSEHLIARWSRTVGEDMTADAS